MPAVPAFLWLPAEGDGGPRIEQLAEGVGFEPTRERNPLPVFKTGALNHSAILPFCRSGNPHPDRLPESGGARNFASPRRLFDVWMGASPADAADLRPFEGQVVHQP